LDPLLDQVAAELPTIPKQTTGRALSHLAATDLGIFLTDYGREAPWKDDAKAATIFKTCIDIAFDRCHYAYAALMQNGRGSLARDIVRTYAHFAVASTSLKEASARMDTLAKVMT